MIFYWPSTTWSFVIFWQRPSFPFKPRVINGRPLTMKSFVCHQAFLFYLLNFFFKYISWLVMQMHIWNLKCNWRLINHEKFCVPLGSGWHCRLFIGLVRAIAWLLDFWQWSYCFRTIKAQSDDFRMRLITDYLFQRSWQGGSHILDRNHWNNRQTLGNISIPNKIRSHSRAKTILEYPVFKTSRGSLHGFLTSTRYKKIWFSSFKSK